MPPRSTPLLGFKPPFVKGGEVALPVLTGSGEWAELTASPAVWREISGALRDRCGVVPATPRADAAPAQRQRRRFGVPADRYLAATLDYLANRFPSRRACAAAHGLPSVGAWDRWRGLHAAEIAAAAARAPVAKPGGRLL